MDHEAWPELLTLGGSAAAVVFLAFAVWSAIAKARRSRREAVRPDLVILKEFVSGGGDRLVLPAWRNVGRGAAFDIRLIPAEAPDCDLSLTTFFSHGTIGPGEEKRHNQIAVPLGPSASPQGASGAFRVTYKDLHGTGYSKEYRWSYRPGAGWDLQVVEPA